MILATSGNDLNRGLRAEITRRLAEQAQAQAQQGERVRVLVESVLNGPEHRVLNNGRAVSIGEIVFVASGPYAADLVQAGIVERAPYDSSPSASNPVPAQVETVARLENVAPATSHATTQSTADVAPVAPVHAIDEVDRRIDLDPWPDHTPLMQGGLNEVQATAVYQRGFTSKRRLVESYRANGVSELTAIRGIGPVIAKRLMRWAGADVGE